MKQLSGMDNLTHALFWSLSANLSAYVVLSPWRGPPADAETAAAPIVEASAPSVSLTTAVVSPETASPTISSVINISAA